MSDHVPTVPEPKKVEAHGHTEAGAKAEIVWRKAAEVTDIHVREISKVIVA